LLTLKNGVVDFNDLTFIGGINKEARFYIITNANQLRINFTVFFKTCSAGEIEVE